MIRSKRAALVCASILGFFPVSFGPALAYTPHIGDRAAPLSGRDIINGGATSLEDYLGRWVLVDFWRSDCGSCVHDLPLLLESARPYREAGRLEVLLVNLDHPENVAAVKQVLREQRVDCPVIYCAGSSQIVGLVEQPDYVAPQAREWNIRGVPATFLIDSQGVIVAKHLRREMAPAALDYFLNLDEPYPPVSLRTSFAVQDSDQVVLRLEVSNPRRTPLELEVNYALVEADIIEFQGMTIPSNRRRHNPVEGGPEQLLTVTFPDQSEQIIEIGIDVGDYEGVEYRVRVLLPGTEDLLNGAGLWIKQFGFIYFGFPGWTYEST